MFSKIKACKLRKIYMFHVVRCNEILGAQSSINAILIRLLFVVMQQLTKVVDIKTNKINILKLYIYIIYLRLHVKRLLLFIFKIIICIKLTIKVL